MIVTHDGKATVEGAVVKENAAAQIVGTVPGTSGINRDSRHRIKCDIIDFGPLARFQLMIVLHLSCIVAGVISLECMGAIGGYRGVCAGTGAQRQQHSCDQECKPFSHHIFSLVRTIACIHYGGSHLCYVCAVLHDHYLIAATGAALKNECTAQGVVPVRVVPVSGGGVEGYPNRQTIAGANQQTYQKIKNSLDSKCSCSKG